ncbi:MAG: biopolymer transporter ExbD [Desulfobacteraceae bacterium IS3]|nr:MAG: biopolymer transporter ExbD [Desulfobacteraceae bacterium IS3]
MDEKEFDYMNVIPLVDVMLVLFTIVLMTSTFIASGGIPVELPKASKNYEETSKAQTVAIEKNGGIFLNSTPVTIDKLKDSMKLIGRDMPILIRADKAVSVQAFVDVLDIVKNLGFRKVSLQTQERK